MKNKRWMTALLCSVLLLGGCGNSGMDGEAPDNQVQAEGEQKSSENVSEGQAGTEQTDMENDGGGAPDSNVGDDVVVVEAGPDKKVYETGSLIYTLHDFRLYEGPEDASVVPEKQVMIDAEYYADQSKFLLMQVDIHNIDYQGDDNDGNGEMNLSMFMIMPREQDESNQWGGSLPVYLSEHGQGETDYYHVFVEPEETKTITVGFYVPVSDGEELRTRCVISVCGNMDEGYVYEIPKVQ